MKNIEKLYSMLIALVIGYIPLLVHMHSYNTNLSKFDWFADVNETQNDFFLYYKMIALIAVGVIVFFVLATNYLKKSRRFEFHSNGFYFLLAYVVLVVLSGVFSPYREYAFRGGYEVFESVWVLLSYALICFFAYQCNSAETYAKNTIQYSLAGIMIVAGIGFFQFFNLDFFKTTIGKKIITPSYMWNNLEDIRFTFGDRVSYTTLYNTNYLAFYFGLIIPILLMLVIFDKRKMMRCIYMVILIFSFVSIVGSGSKSLLLAFAVAFLLAIFIFRKAIIKHKWVILVAAAAFACLIGAYAAKMGGLNNLWYMIIHGGASNDAKDSYRINRIDTDDELIFYLDNLRIHVGYDVNEETGNIDMFIRDDDGNDIPGEYTGDNYLTLKVKDTETYADCGVTPVYIGDLLCIQVDIDGLQMHFTNQTDGTYYYYNKVGKFTKIDYVEESNVFRDSFLSGRGSLWNKIIPKLKSCILLGTGANTFVIDYPNDNYILKEYAQTYYLYDVKAHSFYFQQFLENGLLALIAVILFYLYYFIDAVKIYSKLKEYDYVSALGIGILLGTFTYMIVAIANDSNVNTAPLYWAFMGIGYAMNRITKEKNNI